MYWKSTLRGFVLSLCLLLTIFSSIPLFGEEIVGKDTADPTNILNVITASKFPNYEFAFGVRAGYLQSLREFSDLVSGAFSGSIYARFNPNPFLKNLLGPYGHYMEGLVFEFEVCNIPAILTDVSDISVITTGFGIGPRYVIPFYSLFSLNIYSNFGLMVSRLNGQVSGYKENFTSFMFRGGFEVEFEMAYHSDLGLGLNYHATFDNSGVNGINFYAYYSYRIGGQPKENQLQLTDKSFEPVFPSKSILYASNKKLGTLTITNTGEDSVSNIKIALYIDNFMDKPSIAPGLFQLKQEETLMVPIYALFNQNVMLLQKDRMVNGEIILTYDIDGQNYTKRETVNIPLYSKNALVWEPLENIAAFVSPDDPIIRKLRSSIETQLSATSDNKGMNKNMIKAMKAFTVLKEMQLKYLSDPNKPFEVSMDKNTARAVDTVQYPSEFLATGSQVGDCDDFSVLYTSLLESIGVPAGFLLTPTHIFTIFDTGEPPTNIQKITEKSDMVLEKNGTLWIPIEATFLDRDKGNFLAAWEHAVNTCKFAKDNITFLSIESAWQQVPSSSISKEMPVNEINYTVVQKGFDDILSQYESSHRAFWQRALSGDIEGLSLAEKQSVAIELVRTNFFEKAGDILLEIHNQGNQDFETLYYLGLALFHGSKDGNKANIQKSIEIFQNAKKALTLPENKLKYEATIDMNLALCHYILGDKEKQIYYYDLAELNNPALAMKFQFLNE